jgi:predicted PurR-regulated permease PerM
MKPSPPPDESSPLSPVPRRVLRFELAPKTMLIALLMIAAVWVLVKLLPVVLMFVATLVLVFTLNPIVGWLETKRIRRKGAIAIVFGSAVVLTALLIFLTIPPLIVQLRGLVEREPEIRGHAVELLQRSSLTNPLAEQLKNLDYSERLKSSEATVLSATKNAFEVLAYLSASIFLALYFMIDRYRLRGAIFAVVPRGHHIRFSRVLLNLETIVGGYIRGQVVTCALMTAFILVLLLVCRVPNALALAMLGGVMDVLPYLGPLLTIAPAVFAAYGNGPVIAVVVFAALLLYEEFESRVLVPLVYGRALRLPSAVVFFSLIVGAVLGGIVGALLALPLAAAIVMLIDQLRVDLPGETEQPQDVETRRKDEQQEREYEKRTEQKTTAKAAAIAVEIAKERKQEENNPRPDR